MLPKPAPEGRTDTLQCLKLPKCWQLISNTNIYYKMYIHQLKGSTETLQLAYIYIPIVGWIYAIPTIYVFFDIYNIYICIRFEEYMSVEFIFWYWIRVTKCTFLTYTYICIEYMLPTFWGIHVSWRSSVHPSGAGLGNVHFVTYIFVSDICGQHLGDICQLEVFCAPFGRRVRECIFFL